MSAAKAINMRNTVRALQNTLFRAAKQSLDRKFGALYDKVYREDVLRTAWKTGQGERRAPGVDRQSFEYIEEVIGVETFHRTGDGAAGAALSAGRAPLLIEKPAANVGDTGDPRSGGAGGVKIMIEPIFEANFALPYGFARSGARTWRSASAAGDHVREADRRHDADKGLP
jgi:hypothetical protein